MHTIVKLYKATKVDEKTSSAAHNRSGSVVSTGSVSSSTVGGVETTILGASHSLNHIQGGVGVVANCGGPLNGLRVSDTSQSLNLPQSNKLRRGPRQRSPVPGGDDGDSIELQTIDVGRGLQHGSSADRLEKEVRQELLNDAETGLSATRTKPSPTTIMLRIFMQAFTLTFLAEWGDRSQLTTIILSARENVYGVIVGGIIGHSICTGLAVIGGRMIAQRISVRTVTLIGGVVFILFAISALFFDPNDEKADVDP